MSASRPIEEDASKYNRLQNSVDADKFQIFEKWLRDNGAHFPQLELRQYRSDSKTNTTTTHDGLRYASNNDSDHAEEKKDGGASDSVAMMSLDSTVDNKTTKLGDKQYAGDNDGSNEMRSVHATTPIPPQTTCVSIPKSCLITVEMGQQTPIGKAVLHSDIELDAPKHIFLMIYLLWDRKMHGSKSFFAPYYDTLPQTLRNMPIFWNEVELQYLQGSHLLSQIQDRAAAIQQDYDRICTLTPEFGGIATIEEFRWARMIVCSRNFGLLINGDRTSALVPYADMLNHHRPRETKWTYCENSQSFTITTLQSIGAGCQVYDSYGQKCNHRFLLNYGFCVERNVEVDGFCPNEVPVEVGLDGFGGVVLFGESLGVKEEEFFGGDKSNEDVGEDVDKGSQQWKDRKVSFWTRGDCSSHMFGGGSSYTALAAAAAMNSSRRDLLNAMMDVGSTSSLREAFPKSPSSPPSSYRHVVRHVKRVRVCVSNNENTRILFSMLRVLACNSAEIDYISRLGGLSSGPSTAAQRLFGLPVAAAGSGASSTTTMRTCRDMRYPIGLANERRAMELLLDVTGRSLSKYPTSLAQDNSDLLDEAAYPKYSNKRNAKLQVRGEKEVLHHFALWARTAMHVIDIISHELSEERKSDSGGSATTSNRNSEELGFEYVIRAMEDDDDCHFTILRYCSDVLGAVRRDELSRKAL